MISKAYYSLGDRSIRLRKIFSAFFAVASLSGCSLSFGLPIQSAARPLGLDTVGPVQKGGSDAASLLFMNDHLRDYQVWVDRTLSEASPINDSAYSLDPSKLVLRHDLENLRVYFIGEGAGYHNSLGVNLSGGGGQPMLLFPDASSYRSGNRNARYPLQPGDFVDVGSVLSDAFINFFLIANGANGGSRVWSTDSRLNSDDINHVVSYSEQGSPYLLIGFEDLPGGGDRDFNDLVFVVDIGSENVQAMQRASVSDGSSTYVLTVLGLGFLFVAKKRMQKHVV